MKKLLNISVIAALAILPMVANAAPVSGDPTTLGDNPPGGQTAQNVTAGAAPKYQLAEANNAVDGVVATAGYVKGAYNAAIKAINKVSETATNAANQDLSNLSSTGKANIAAQGTYDANGTYTGGTVGAAIQGKADKATTLSGYGITDAYTKTEVDSAITSGAVQTVAKGTGNGTITVDGGADVTIYDDTALANRVTTAEGKITTLEGTVGNSTSGLVADVAALQNASGNYATKTGVETTVTNALNAATVDISGLDVTNGGLTGTGTATVPVITTWGANSTSDTVSASVSLAGVTTNVGLTGDTTPVTVTAGTVSYPANP